MTPLELALCIEALQMYRDAAPYADHPEIDSVLHKLVEQLTGAQCTKS